MTQQLAQQIIDHLDDGWTHGIRLDNGTYGLACLTQTAEVERHFGIKLTSRPATDSETAQMKPIWPQFGDIPTVCY